MSAVLLLVWAAGGALCAAMSVDAVHGIWPPPEKAVVSYTVAFVGISIGVIVWQLRPDSRTGIMIYNAPGIGISAR